MENNSSHTQNTKIFQVRPVNEKRNDFVITIGDNLASEKHFESEKQAQKYINARPWELIFSLAIFTSQRTYEIKNQHKESEQ